MFCKLTDELIMTKKSIEKNPTFDTDLLRWAFIFQTKQNRSKKCVLIILSGNKFSKIQVIC